MIGTVIVGLPMHSDGPDNMIIWVWEPKQISHDSDTNINKDLSSQGIAHANRFEKLSMFSLEQFKYGWLSWKLSFWCDL
jgi:hypothetical protein